MKRLPGDQVPVVTGKGLAFCAPPILCLPLQTALLIGGLRGKGVVCLIQGLTNPLHSQSLCDAGLRMWHTPHKVLNQP